MNLNPDVFTCPDDETDLTQRVKDVVNGQFDNVYSIRLTQPKAGPPKRFEVVVTCPGAKGGEPHLCTCTGTYTP